MEIITMSGWLLTSPNAPTKVLCVRLTLANDMLAVDIKLYVETL